MRLATLIDGRPARVEAGALLPLPGRLIDHLCRPPSDPIAEAVPAERATLGAPIARPPKIIGVGLNYVDHAKETGQEEPSEPLLFGKLATSVIGPGVPIRIPPGASKVDYEAELAVVIGRAAKDLSQDEALDAVGGYACFNDVSERAVQKADGQWLRAKSFDTFGPFGPWVVTPDEVGDPNALAIKSIVNGEVRQDSSTSLMIHSVAAIVSFCSKAFPLEPGDVIATGTPAGVGMASNSYLKPGDTVMIEVEGLGSLTNAIE
jgi:2-keto-4-pentenoate hydratase/2-oxohepta-3-ene-1,7-dioic acid hydratase in catechol pathway